MIQQEQTESQIQKQDFILLIMNCKKYIKKALFQKQTWLKQIPSYLKYYHVVGNEELETDYVFDNENQVLWVKVADDYNSLPKKVIRAYEAVSKTFDFKYLFKTDDDQILVKPAFWDIITKLVTTKMPPPHYGGFVVNVKQAYLSEYSRIHSELPEKIPIYPTSYCSGRFYFLSNLAIKNLIGKKEMISKEYLEDYAIGFYLNNFYKRTIQHIATNNFFTDIEQSDFPQLINENKI
jgi:hypothetical protein